MYIITTSLQDGKVVYFDGNGFTLNINEAVLLSIQDAITTRHKIREQFPCCDILTM